MVGKVLQWLRERPTFFAQKPLVKRWPDELTRDIGKSAKPMSILSGPEHPVLLQRFREQGFFGMSLREVDGLIGGLGRRKSKSKPKVIDREGISIIR